MRGLASGAAWLGNAELPHPPLMEGTLCLIEKVIREGWRQACVTLAHSGITASTVKEDQITETVQQAIEELRYSNPSPVQGFSADSFETIHHGGDLRDCRNTSIGKRPDLVFKSVGRREGVSAKTSLYDGLYVECKPVDARHRFRDTYCDKGLIKFVDGRYAWAMREAMMAAYVFDGSVLSAKLTKALSEKPTEYRLVSGPSPCPGKSDSDCGDTIHNRDCVYSHTGKPAGPIRIRHVWLYPKSGT